MLLALPTEVELIIQVARELEIEATLLDGSRLVLLESMGDNQVIDCLNLSSLLAYPQHLDLELNKLIHEDLDQAKKLIKYLLRDLFPKLCGDRMYDVLRHVLPKNEPKSVCDISREFQSKQPEHWFYKPVCIEMELTHRCSLKCIECSIIEDVKRAEHGLSVEEALSVLSQGAKLGMYAYTITGGEPFTRFDDVCQIIKETPELDCHKLQTNGTFFSSARKAKLLLEKLKASGFGSRNRFVRSGLHCSVGIQNYKGGVSLKAAWNLAQAFQSTFETDSCQLSYILTHHHGIAPEIARRDILRELQLVASDIIDEEDFHLRVVQIHRTPALAKEHDKINKVPLGELVKFYATYWKCFDADGIQSPYPQILIRANGEVFACSCFGHVFNLGNIRKHSLMQLIEYANSLELLKMIRYEGLLGYLEYARKFDPDIITREIAPTTTICKICGTLKSLIESTSTKTVASKKSVAASRLKIIE